MNFMQSSNIFTKRNIHLKPPQILVLGFAITILIGTILLSLPLASKNGESVGMLNALFTATSAVCVTGLVVVDTVSHWTFFGQFVIISLIQIGGLGFMTMTTLFFLFARKKITIKERMVIQSSLNRNTLSGIIRFTKNILIFTFLVEGVGALVLSLRFIPEFGFLKGMWMSIFHSISAFSNAGFDLIGGFRSLSPYAADLTINITVMLLIILGGLGFSVIVDLIEHKEFKRFSVHSKLVLIITVGLIVLGAIFIYILETNNANTLKNLPFGEKVLAATFQSVSPRTAGFNTVDLSQFTIAAQFLIIILMFIGGSPGSTAGGVKTSTIGILLITVISVLAGKQDTEVFKRRIPFNIIRKALAVIMISFSIIVFVTMILTIFEQGTFIEILFEVVSAFGTVGLSLGITPDLTTIGKITIIITMFIGRVGPLTIGFAIVKRQGEYAERNYKYPKTNILVG